MLKKNIRLYGLMVTCLLGQATLLSAQQYSERAKVRSVANPLERPDPMKRTYLTPRRIVWQSAGETVKNAEVLLKPGVKQAFFGNKEVMRLNNTSGDTSSIVLDFGKEILGGVRITTAQGNNVVPRVRIRFGESVSEVFSESMNVHRGSDGASNHHALRDFEQRLPGFGTLEVGNTGFRFVRIDLLDADKELAIQEITAISTARDIPYLGSFRSNDERLNQIWQTGAYTVHLDMQDYLVDGIKRDRMVWAGDIHPQLMTINHVFGYQDVVPNSLDFLRDQTPLPKFMNGIPTYSLWWLIMQHDWYHYQGNLAYLEEQRSYLLGLLDVVAQHVDENGQEQFHDGGMRFLDWPTYGKKKEVDAGIQAMTVMALERGVKMLKVLGEDAAAKKYTTLLERMRKQAPGLGESKQAAALLALANLVDAKTANEKVIAVDGAKRFGAFFGYYMLQAQAQAGDYQGALQNIRDFWGGMLDLGATTFWEEFDLEEAQGAARIDELVPAGKKDYLRTTGIECYIGLRRSLSHGWSSGPSAWLSEHVLGIQILEPGAKKVKIEPHLGDLEWVEGTYPTPYGLIHVKHEKQKNGQIKTDVKVPKEVKIVK